jgi:DNA-binding SARP family transcriptional activator/sugar lactone lactonase YvrE
VEIRYLGPFDVVDADESIAVGGGRQRALLAILALSAGEVVPVGRLIDELWPDHPPDSAQNTVQAYVSRLRKAMRPVKREGEAILFEHGGYRLDVSRDEIDAHRFRGLVEEGERQARAGNAELAASTLRDALALWHGPPLADFAYEPFAQAEITRLNELRLAALESRIDADLECGRHAALVPELEALVNEHPHREGLRRELMLALYRSGRQGEALEVYTDTHARLDADLGIEPTPELRELQHAILSQDPVLDAPLAVAKDHQVDRDVRRRRWPLAAGFASAVVLALVAAAIVLRPSRSAAAVHVVRNSVAVVDSRTNEIVDDVVVGDYPGPVAAGGGSIWVGNIGDSTVTEIHGDTREPEFPASAQRPVDLAVSEDALWIANSSDFATQPPTGGGTVVRRALDTGAIQTTTLGPPRTPDEMSTFVATDGRTVWAANTNSRTIAKLDPATGRVLMRVHGLASGGIAAGDGAVWVPQPKRDLVVRLNIHTGRVDARIPVSGNPSRVAVGEGGVWVITTGSHSAVWRIDPKSNETVSVIPVPLKARRIATGEGYVWVTSGRDDPETVRRPGVLSKIDPRTNGILATIPLGFRPDGLAVSNSLVWVAVAPV